MPASADATINGSANVNSKTYLFGNPHSFRCQHDYNGFGLAGEGTDKRIYDITEASITKGGDVSMSRADNDFYPRNGGTFDGTFGLRVTSKNVTAFNTFTKGDECSGIEVQYEGRAEARAKTLGLTLAQGLISDDITVTGQHGSESSTAQVGIDAIIPVDAGGTGLGAGYGPYSIPWALNVSDDDTRDDTWAPISL